MTWRAARGSAVVLGFAALVAACESGDGKARAGRPRVDDRHLTPAERDADALGRDIFEMVDRAVEYRGSHRGRPAASVRQLGVDSLTPTMVRRVVNLNREPIVTVAFRRPQDHEIVSCRGDSQVLEEAAVGGGRFTIMCITGSGAQRPVQVGAAGGTAP